MEKNFLHKINEVIDNDIIIVRKLAEKTIKRVKKEPILKSLLLLHLLFNRTETLKKDLPFMLFLYKELDLKNSRFPSFDDVINIMLVFMTYKVPFFSYFSNSFAFLTQIRKTCAMSEVSTKNRIIWDTNSINMWILAD